VAFPDTLETLIEDGVIDAVKSRLMSGKEAAVFVVERQGELLAAKVYKAREQRTFKATASYTEGRNQTRNSRDKRAMGKRSSYGKELIEESWRDVEVRALSEAFHAGVRVPRPFMLHDDVLLMELLVDESGAPAPRLADFELPREVAEQLHREIFNQVRLLLSCGKIHGDLSAFNILMARGGPTLIDMPQVVDAARNNQAREILRRDLRNITEHLARFDARLLRFRDCGDALWQHYVNGTLDRATEPQEGGVGGGHHRSRRTRDAERGRMGRERQDPAAARRDGPPPQGPPRQGAPGQGPPRDGPRQGTPSQGPPRDRQFQPEAAGPPRDRQFQPEAAGPPRDRPFQPGTEGPRRDRPFPPRPAGPPRDRPFLQGTEGPPRDRPFPQGSQGPSRDRRLPPGTEGPPRDRPLRAGTEGPRREGPFQPRTEGPRREGPFPHGAEGPRREGPRHGAPGQGPQRDGPPPRGSSGEPRERQQRPGAPRPGSWQGPREGQPRHPAPRPGDSGQGPPRHQPPRPGDSGQGPPRHEGHGQAAPRGSGAAFQQSPRPTPPGQEPPRDPQPRPAPAQDGAADGPPRWDAPRDEPSGGGPRR